MRILYVDDSRAVRDSAVTIFQEHGHDTLTAGDGFDALCQLGQIIQEGAQPPAIIFMDIMMPRLDGFQTCALITGSEGFSDIPVMLVSASDGPLERARADLAGARGLLQKPFSRQELLACLAEIADTDSSGSALQA